MLFNQANMESEELQREFSSLERLTTYKSTLNSSIAEVLKLFEDKSVQDNIQGTLLDSVVNTMRKRKGQRRTLPQIYLFDAIPHQVQTLQVHQLCSVCLLLLTNIVLVCSGCSLTSTLMACSSLFFNIARIISIEKGHQCRPGC